jgi:hypothetical protein
MGSCHGPVRLSAALLVSVTPRAASTRGCVRRLRVCRQSPRASSRPVALPRSRAGACCIRRWRQPQRQRFRSAGRVSRSVVNRLDAAGYGRRGRNRALAGSSRIGGISTDKCSATAYFIPLGKHGDVGYWRLPITRGARIRHRCMAGIERGAAAATLLAQAHNVSRPRASRSPHGHGKPSSIITRGAQRRGASDVDFPPS